MLWPQNCVYYLLRQIEVMYLFFTFQLEIKYRCYLYSIFRNLSFLLYPNGFSKLAEAITQGLRQRVSLKIRIQNIILYLKHNVPQIDIILLKISVQILI